MNQVDKITIRAEGNYLAVPFRLYFGAQLAHSQVSDKRERAQSLGGFKAAKGKELLSVGGPLGAMDHLVASVGVTQNAKFLIHSILDYSKYKSKSEYFPTDNETQSYTDQD